jgi:hypothetical protein
MASAIPNFDSQRMLHILACNLFASTPKGRGVPVVMIGPPGTAKSASIEAALKGFGLDPYSLSPGLMGEAFFGVTPVPVTVGDDLVLRFPTPERLHSIKRSPGAALFVDEMNAVVSAAQLPPMLGMLQDRRVGDFFMGTQCRIIAAMNPQHIAANGVRLSIPQANRVAMWEWSAVTSAQRNNYLRTLSSVAQPWAIERDAVVRNDIREELEARMDQYHAQAMHDAVSLISAGFLAAHPQRRNMMPQASSKEAVSPWPSDRSWTNAMALFAASQILCSNTYPLPPNSSDMLRELRLKSGDLRNLQQELIASCVGLETAQLFAKWHKDLDLPDVGQWMQGNAEMRSHKTGDNAVFISGIYSWMRAHANELNQTTAHRYGERVFSYIHWLASNGLLDLSIILLQDVVNDKGDLYGVYCDPNIGPERRRATDKIRESGRELMAIQGML